MNGILLIDKPAMWTSFDVVNYVRKMVAAVEGKKSKKVKVGHTGTLDPLATGLLVLLIGDYTKRAPELSKLDKTYEVTMRLGKTSTTGDREGVIKDISDKKPNEFEVEAVFRKFTGEIFQTPPAYSAVKINGQRAYKLARAGIKVEIEPRKVNIYRVKLTNFNYPNIKFMADVSSGTYMRSFVEDIGKELGTGGFIAELRRTKVGNFNLGDSHQFKEEKLLQYVTDL